MIVPMKKAYIIFQAKDKLPALKTLRKLGLIHIEHIKVPQGQDITTITEELNLINRAIDILEEAAKTGVSGDAYIEKSDFLTVARHVVGVSRKIEQLKEFSLNLSSKIETWKDWGDFDPKQIIALREKGISIKLFHIPEKDIRNFCQDVIVKTFFRKKGMVNCAIIYRGDISFSLQELELPKSSLGEMQQRIARDAEAIQILQGDLLKHVNYLLQFRKIKRSMQIGLEFQQAIQGMAEYQDLVCLKGFLPFDQESFLLNQAKARGWGIQITDPLEDERIPTLVRNPRWVSIISPIFKVIEVVPGYRELDISLWFLIFFAIFFGMLIGDAGYGLVYFLITLIIQLIWGKKIVDKTPFKLSYLLSSCAIIWGILSATFFGQQWLAAYFKPLIPALQQEKSVQAICFFIGTVHLSIAHLWRLILRFPHVVFLSELGWIAIIWSAFFFAKFLILEDSLPLFLKWLLAGGSILILFFSNPNKNIFKTVGAGLTALLLNLMNNFTDLVSYIRIFAVGLATVAVADAFNTMAQASGFGSFYSGLISSVILLIGHTLNIILGPLSVLVHGVRLNVLEFCMHLDVKWSGFKYEPFKEEAAY